jgi:hypothetical protein
MMDTQESTSIQDRMEHVKSRIFRAAQSAGRDPGRIKLVVVTKGQPIHIIQEAISAGARFLGENYVEEAQAKIEMNPVESDVEWHMIGHIQSRKAKSVVEHFSYVHSVDSFKLANKLAGFCRETGKILPVLLECNVTGEESKFGWECWDKRTWPVMVDQMIQLQEIQGIHVKGLMTMAPYYENPEQARTAFRQLRMLRDFLASRVSESGLQELSMGMSGDFEIAVDEGSTMVRIGTAILGIRKQPN